MSWNFLTVLVLTAGSFLFPGLAWLVSSHVYVRVYFFFMTLFSLLCFVPWTLVWLDSSRVYMRCINIILYMQQLHMQHIFFIIAPFYVTSFMLVWFQFACLSFQDARVLESSSIRESQRVHSPFVPSLCNETEFLCHFSARHRYSILWGDIETHVWFFLEIFCSFFSVIWGDGHFNFTGRYGLSRLFFCCRPYRICHVLL